MTIPTDKLEHDKEEEHTLELHAGPEHPHAKHITGKQWTIELMNNLIVGTITFSVKATIPGAAMNGT